MNNGRNYSESPCGEKTCSEKEGDEQRGLVLDSGSGTVQVVASDGSTALERCLEKSLVPLACDFCEIHKGAVASRSHWIVRMGTQLG